MGTISEKLTYLNDTKQLLKDSINSLGGEITSQTTFRQYATELDSIYASLPKVSGTGSNIQLTPTKKGRITSQINGDTFQKTYTGKNLFNKTDYSTITTSNNGSPTNVSKTTDKISFTSNSNSGFSGVYITSTNYQNYIDNYDSETTYYISADIKTNVNCDFRFAKESIVTSITAGTTRLTYNGTLPPNLAFYVKNATANIEITNIMISTSSDTTYEKYVGGTASPNPEFPQEIQSVTGLQQINVCGKNLFNYNLFETFTTTIQYLTLNLKPNTQYTMSSDIPVTSGVGTNLFFMINGETASTTNNGVRPDTPRTLTTDNTGIVKIGYRTNSNLSSNPKTDYWYQIELGSATTYEAYSGETYDINLGDIHLYENDQIIGTPDNWSIRHVMGKYILDSTKNWYINGTNNYQVSLGGNDRIYLKQSTTGYSNYFRVSNSGSDIFMWPILQGSTDYIRIVNAINKWATIADFKTFISNNIVELIYPLATPTTTPITDTTLINDLNTFYYAKSKQGQTNISVDGNLPMILDVSALKYTE